MMGPVGTDFNDILDEFHMILLQKYISVHSADQISTALGKTSSRHKCYI